MQIMMVNDVAEFIVTPRNDLHKNDIYLLKIGCNNSFKLRIGPKRHETLFASIAYFPGRSGQAC